MTIQFKDETFRDDYTFRNSEWAIQRFPFPFHEDSYMYSVNLEPHLSLRPGSVYQKTFDVDEHYISEMKDRAKVLADDPLRCQSFRGAVSRPGESSQRGCAPSSTASR